MDIAVTGIRLVDAKPFESDGSLVIATFDCRVGGIAMRDCVLIRRKTGVMLSQPPKVDKRDRLVSWVDRDLAIAVTNAAREKFIAIGGVEAA
jgi:hypothetical protein